MDFSQTRTVQAKQVQATAKCKFKYKKRNKFFTGVLISFDWKSVNHEVRWKQSIYSPLLYLKLIV